MYHNIYLIDLLVLFWILFLRRGNRLLYIHFLCCRRGIFLFGGLGILIFRCILLFYHLLVFYRNLRLYQNYLFLRSLWTMGVFLSLLVLIFVMVLRLLACLAGFCIMVILYGLWGIDHFLSWSRGLMCCRLRMVTLPSSLWTARCLVTIHRLTRGHRLSLGSSRERHSKGTRRLSSAVPWSCTCWIDRSRLSSA